jgi:hypothetical protein
LTLTKFHGELWVQPKEPGFILRNGAGEVFDTSGMVAGFQERPGMMIIVHPGSLCGSYHTSWGFSAMQLEALLSEIHAWRGQFVVFHGDLSDEVPHYAGVKRAIEHARAAGAKDYTVDSSEQELKAGAKEVFQAFRLKGTPTFVTGAWSDEGDGCVTTVAEQLRKLGADVKVSAHSPNDEQA